MKTLLIVIALTGVANAEPFDSAGGNAWLHYELSGVRAREEEAMLALRVGTHYTDWGFPTGNGYFVGVEGREMYDVRYVGLTIGYSIDMATPTRHSRGSDYEVTAASR